MNNLVTICRYIEKYHNELLEGQFYFIQIRQRRKDNPHLKKDTYRVKNYYIKDVQSLINVMPEIIFLCDKFNARAMMCLNRRTYKTISKKMTIQLVYNTLNNLYHLCKTCFDSMCGKHSSEPNKCWVVDIDYDTPRCDDLEIYINNLLPIGDKILTRIPSKTGYHLITSPFDLSKFKIKFKGIDVQKDNPTNLYIPE
jgi:hypothetical protein